MAKLTSTVTLEKILGKLTKQWQEHRDALAKMDAVFSKYGIKPGSGQPAAQGVAVAARPAKAAKGRKRGKRRHFAQTGDEFILGLLSGGRALSTAQINAEWRGAGRAGKADINLSKLTREKKVKRQSIPDGRGSNYTAT